MKEIRFVVHALAWRPDTLKRTQRTLRQAQGKPFDRLMCVRPFDFAQGMVCGIAFFLMFLYALSVALKFYYICHDEL